MNTRRPPNQEKFALENQHENSNKDRSASGFKCHFQILFLDTGCNKDTGIHRLFIWIPLQIECVWSIRLFRTSETFDSPPSWPLTPGTGCHGFFGAAKSLSVCIASLALFSWNSFFWNTTDLRFKFTRKEIHSSRNKEVSRYKAFVLVRPLLQTRCH